MHDIELRNCEEIFLGNHSLNELQGKNSVGNLMTCHVKTKNSMFYVPSQKVKLIKDKMVNFL